VNLNPDAITMIANPLFWKIRLELTGEGQTLLGERDRQKLSEKLADYAREFVLRRKGINAVSDAAGDLAGAGAELLNVERDADHARQQTTAAGRMTS